MEHFLTSTEAPQNYFNEHANFLIKKSIWTNIILDLVKLKWIKCDLNKCIIKK